MQNSKFLTLFRTLSPDEVAAFHKYLKQLHGVDTITLKVFEYIRKFYQDALSDKILELPTVYRKVFRTPLSDNIAADSKKVSNTLSEMYLYLKNFLLHEKLRNDEREAQALWLGILQERELNEEFSKQAVAHQAAVKKEACKSIKEHLSRLRADYFHHHHLTLSGTLEDDTFLQSYIDEVDVCGDLIRLKTICQGMTMGKSFPTYKEPQILKSKGGNTAPLLHLYWAVYLLLTTKSEKNFDQLGSLLEKYADTIDPLEMNDILKYMHVCTAKLVRTGDEISQARKLHPFNMFADKHGFFHKKGNLTTIGFNNIVNVACAVKDFEWVNTFIQKKGHMMPEPVVTLAKAVVLFEQDSFKGVIGLLNSKPFRALSDTLRARLLLSRAYYRNEVDIGQSLDYLDNFEKWLHRNQEALPNSVASARAFIRVFRMLLLEETDKADLLKEIEAAPELYCRSWLRAQALQYKKRYATRKRNK